MGKTLSLSSHHFYLGRSPKATLSGFQNLNITSNKLITTAAKAYEIQGKADSVPRLNI